MTEELKERLSILQMRVYTSMVFSLRDLAGTDQRRDLKTQILRSSIINSQFSTSQPSLLPSQLVVLQELAKLLDKKLSKLKRPFTNAQFTNIQ
jgi:hypothetical protein